MPPLDSMFVRATLQNGDFPIPIKQDVISPPSPPPPPSLKALDSLLMYFFLLSASNQLKNSETRSNHVCDSYSYHLGRQRSTWVGINYFKINTKIIIQWHQCQGKGCTPQNNEHSLSVLLIVAEGL